MVQSREDGDWVLTGGLTLCFYLLNVDGLGRVVVKRKVDWAWLRVMGILGLGLSVSLGLSPRTHCVFSEFRGTKVANFSNSLQTQSAKS